MNLLSVTFKVDQSGSNDPRLPISFRDNVRCVYLPCGAAQGSAVFNKSLTNASRDISKNVFST